MYLIEVHKHLQKVSQKLQINLILHAFYILLYIMNITFLLSAEAFISFNEV